MVYAIIAFQNEWRSYPIAYNELDELSSKPKIICRCNINSVTYAVSLTDTQDLNIICTNVLNRETYGSVIFITMKNSQLVDMTQAVINDILKLTPGDLHNEISQPVDDLSNMINNLEIVENVMDSQDYDDIFEAEYYESFDKCGYDSN